MEETIVVNEELTTPTTTEVEIQETVTEETVLPAPGSKTDSELLLQALHKEREEKRILKEEKRILEERVNASTFTTEEEVFSDEGKSLKKHINTLEGEIKSIKEEKALQEIISKFPVLKDKTEELKNFSQDYPNTDLAKVAKLYLSENGLLETPRKGLEKPTGGTRTPTSSGMTAEDVKTLRETNYKKYQDMIMKGQIKVA